MVEAVATTALRAARRLQLAVEARNAVGLQRVVQAASALQAAIQQRVLCRETRISGRWGKLQSAPQLRNKYNYLKRKLDQAKRAQDHKLRRCNNSIANYWIVRAGLSDPGLSTRSVADWCGDVHVTAPFWQFLQWLMRERFLRGVERHGSRQVARFLCVRAPRMGPGETGPR